MTFVNLDYVEEIDFYFPPSANAAFVEEVAGTEGCIKLDTEEFKEKIKKGKGQITVLIPSAL